MTDSPDPPRFPLRNRRGPVRETAASGGGGADGGSELVVESLRVTFDGVTAVDDVSLRVRGHEIVAILGPSGCGKSSLLRAIVGLESLGGGRVLFDGVDQAAVAVHRRGFGLMFQDGQLFENLSVARNVGYGPRRRGMSKASAAETVAELLTLVGLDGYGSRAPSTLSGGERQRVALARALAARPRLLLLDEPLSALDASLRVRLAADLRRILKQTDTMGLLVTHDHEEAFAIADRVVLMRAGRFIQGGTPREVWSKPVDEEAALFLGYARVLRGEQLVPMRSAFGLGPQPLALRRNALRLIPRSSSTTRSFGEPDRSSSEPHRSSSEPHRSSSERGTSDVETPQAANVRNESPAYAPHRVSASASASASASLDDRSFSTSADGRGVRASAAANVLTATVIAVAPALDELRLLVRLADGQEVDAVAPIDAVIHAGDEVELELVTSATAVLEE